MYLKRYTCCLLIALFFWGCHKVDQQLHTIKSQPWFAEGYSLFGHYGGGEWDYPQQLVIGDTAIMMGHLFPDKPDFQLTIGNATVKPVDFMRLPFNLTVSGADMDSMDLVRFVVTADMGVGQNRPVTLTANGITIHGNPVNIRSIAASLGRTDTTLWVDPVAHWLPDNISDYKANYSYVVRNSHITRDGIIYFDDKFGIYNTAGGDVHAMIKAGDKLQDDAGNFRIAQVLSSAISYDGQTLYFSAEVKEPTPDTIVEYQFRLCKMDLATQKITNINRSVVLNHTSTVPKDGSPYQGNIAQVQTVALNLSVDINGNLFYGNVYAPDNDSDDHSVWYYQLNTGQIVDMLDNNLLEICRMDATGHASVLISLPWTYGTPGAPGGSSSYTLDISGKYLYTMYLDMNTFNSRTMQYDIEQQQAVAYYDYNSSLIFHSYEKDPAFLRTGNLIFPAPYTPVPGSYLPLSDGSLLIDGSASLVDIDLANQAAYCYAGSEIGITGNPPDAQKNFTGAARLVLFPSVSFIGQDKTGAVFFASRPDDYQNGVTFYKLYPKK